MRNDQAPTLEDDDADHVGEHDGALSIKLTVGCPSRQFRLVSIFIIDVNSLAKNPPPRTTPTTKIFWLLIPQNPLKSNDYDL